MLEESYSDPSLNRRTLIFDGLFSSASYMNKPLFTVSDESPR